jgi:hypothetical protein
MATITVKDIPDDLYAALKQSAADNYLITFAGKLLAAFPNPALTPTTFLALTG